MNMNASEWCGIFMDMYHLINHSTGVAKDDLLTTDKHAL